MLRAKFLTTMVLSAFAVCGSLQAHTGVHIASDEKKECCGKDGKCCKDDKKECCGEDGKCCKKKDSSTHTHATDEKKECCGKDGKCCKDDKKECCGEDGKCCKKEKEE